MFVLLAAALLALDAPPAVDDAAARREYQAARAAAGRSPDDQVRLAYWCEAHGLTAERLRHLAQAVIADPNHAAARGLLGLVARADRWARPDAVAEQVRADATLAATLQEYDRKRSAAAYTADVQQALARWADEHGLKDQARAHYTAAVRLDPRRDAAWKKLGYRKHDGRWTTDAEVAAARADAEAQKQADHKWKPLLERWRSMLGKAATRGEAEAGLLSVTDPRAVRSIEQVFLGANPNPTVAVRTLAQVDSAAASRLITSIAVLADDPNVRRAAVETLRQRDPRDYADLLVRSLRERIEYDVRRVSGPGSTGQLVLKGSKQRVQRLYSTPAVPNYLTWLTQVSDGAPTLTYYYQGEAVKSQALGSQNLNVAELMRFRPTEAQVRADPHFNAQIQQAQANPMGQMMASVSRPDSELGTRLRAVNALGAERLLNQNTSWNITTRVDTAVPLETASTVPLAAMINEYRKTAVAAEQQLELDIAQLDAHNRAVDESNDRVTSALRNVSGVDHAAEVAGWTGWLVNLNGYAMSQQSQGEVPTYTVDVPLAYQPQSMSTSATTYQSGPVTQTVHSEVSVFTHGIGDCFAAGTPVRTLTGPRPIESLRVGDMVLTQSTGTGALRYQPVLVVHHNPPSPTFRVKLGADAIVTSPFHRFWKVGQGWVMARNIRAGDRLRLLSGTAVVEESTAGKTELVYNLDVAEDADFFAGDTAVLVHDNTLLDPRQVPFDLPQADPKPVTAR